MPKTLRWYLTNLRALNPKEADLVWEWLDSNPEAIHEMIQLIGVEVSEKCKEG